ncbi:MAG: NAD-dependent epimerase/dehydratase family protein [Gammaproteobacteria bacterium]|nr:NAD-dependent epimerase/dehydratase family protein [Gammaproteobacteria bacterium]NNF60197.1 NAD-dependent epimerase/dehydratase family protein [Gammaproteobacteria bacterium]NNM21610.1 NAD-dependent epimerase/dehydratase family protein [Gammaproteobacteria bacterium]
MSRRFIIAGCGYTGRRLADRLSPQNHVLCLTRSSRRRDQLAQHGLNTIATDLGAPADIDTSGAVVVYLAPPPPDGDRDTTLEGFLRSIDVPARFVYASTSGVYGDCGGAIVNESQPVAPATARAARRVAAEQALLEWGLQAGVETVVLRVAGIYGPGRLPLERIRRRDPVLRAEDAGPGNRIHVSDLAAACERAALIEAPPTPVNICDGNHMSSTEFTNLVATISGAPKPPAIDRDQAQKIFSPMRWSFLAESRRLDNTRMREHLGVELRYADPADGIRQALQFDY